MICILQRSFLNSGFDSERMSLPARFTLPDLLFVRASSALATVVFPLPLSPARHMTSPLRTLNETSSTARTHSSFLVKIPETPLRAGNQTDRFLTLRNASCCVRSSLPEVFRGTSHCGDMPHSDPCPHSDIRDPVFDMSHLAMGILGETCNRSAAM